jgi:hypothetical protein
MKAVVMGEKTGMAIALIYSDERFRCRAGNNRKNINLKSRKASNNGKQKESNGKSQENAESA